MTTDRRHTQTADSAEEFAAPPPGEERPGGASTPSSAASQPHDAHSSAEQTKDHAGASPADAPASSTVDSEPASTAESPDDGAEAFSASAPSEGESAEIVEEDIDELVKVAQQRDEYLALAQRTQADFENYRKRMAREARVAEARGVVKVVRELLPALDSLSRALEAAAQDDPLLDGVRLVQSEITAALARLGVESYSPAGERFDPSEHEAMAQQPVEGADSGTVVEVYQAGYRLNGTVIRPARVVVAA